MDKFKEECGVFGIFGHKEASNLTYLGLYALQHRGHESAGIEAAVVEAISQVRGAFSFVMMTKDRIIGARDPHGFRPLALGKLGEAFVICSETCALDLIGATYVRDVEPGEVVIFSSTGLKSLK